MARCQWSVLFVLAAFLLLLIVFTVNCYPVDQSEEDEHPRLSLISWRWDEVRSYLVVTAFLLGAATIKICYHHSHTLHTHVPESCVLIVLGTVVGMIIHMADIKGSIPTFSSERFFFILLPPIILESAYSLHDKTFFNNIRAILLYAVVGTLLNVFLVGSSLFVVEQFGWFGREDIPLVECFTFSTLISAVDPVAVLAIFQELGVNKSLYFLVFGESLLNDAVVITLYNMVTTFAVSRVISTYDVIIGILNFITVSGGGLFIGVLMGAITALVTRVTNDVRVVEPLIVVCLAYFSYVFSELFHFSGIIALIACGLMQAEYVKDNISVRSFTTIKYFTKTLSSIADVIIFYFLGRVLIRDDHVWDTGFVFFSTFFCVVYRFVSVFLLTYIANRKLQRVRMINFEEQLLMAYGGLRGAIAFSLATLLEEAHVKHARIFITTSLFIVLFTVFVLGSTTKPVVRWLEVQLHVHQDTMMFGEINNKVMETVMAGIEEIAGYRSVNYWNQKLLRFNEKYIKGFLTQGDGHSFTDTFEMIYNIIPHRSKKWMTAQSEDEVFKEEPSATTQGDSVEDLEAGQSKKHRSLTRTSSKGQRPSRSSMEEKDATDDRRTLAAAFARNAFYQVPEKDEVDDERQQREAREAKRSDKRKANRWTSAKTRLEVMAAGSSPHPGESSPTGTADSSAAAADELGPLRKLLAAKRSSFFAVAEGALLKKREDERKASMVSKSSADYGDSRKTSEASAALRQDLTEGGDASSADGVSKLDEDISFSESVPPTQPAAESDPIAHQMADQMARTIIDEAKSHSEDTAKPKE